MSVEKQRGDERQTVKQERERQRTSATRCAQYLSTATGSVDACKKLFQFIYVPGLSSAVCSAAVFSTFSTFRISAPFAIVWLFFMEKRSSAPLCGVDHMCLSI